MKDKDSFCVCHLLLFFFLQKNVTIFTTKQYDFHCFGDIYIYKHNLFFTENTSLILLSSHDGKITYA